MEVENQRKLQEEITHALERERLEML